MKQLKALYLNNFQDFMKNVIQLTKDGKEVDMTQTRIVYGRVYHLKYWDEADVEQIQPTNDSAPQDNLVGNTEDSVQPAINYDELSDDEIRELAKEAKIQGAHNAKRETLIKKLQAKAD